MHAKVDTSIAASAMAIHIITKDGRSLSKEIKKVLGSLENPLGDSALDNKTRDLCQPILGKEKTETLIETCRNMAFLKDSSKVVRAATL